MGDVDEGRKPTTGIQPVAEVLWATLVDTVKACLQFHEDMDYDDRMQFATVLRQLAVEEERMALSQRQQEYLVTQIGMALAEIQ